MKVAKWGNSLAVRIPSGVAERLKLREGDEVEVRVAVGDRLVLTKMRSPKELRTAVRKLRGTIPADYKFRREDAYDE